MKRFNSLLTLCLVISSALGLTACSKTNGDGLLGAGESAPQLPSQSTMMMDLSFFGVEGVQSQSAAADKAASAEAQLAAAGEKSNWIQAVVRVIFVQLTLYDALEEPIYAFAAAINAVPQPQPDGSYLWTYIFVDGAEEYSIFLYGKDEGDHIDWRMEVSSNDPEMLLDHFVWFDGASQKDESFGYWQFYVPAGSPEAVAAGLGLGAASTEGIPVVRIEWEHGGPKANRLTLVNNMPGGEDEGDTLEFVETPTKGMLDFDDVSAGEHHNITWYANGSGSITVPDYNNGETACWDTQLENVACE